MHYDLLLATSFLLFFLYFRVRSTAVLCFCYFIEGLERGWGLGVMGWQLDFRTTYPIYSLYIRLCFLQHSLACRTPLTY